jgi:hypothetical protein
MIPVLVKSVWLRNICFSKVATTLFKFIDRFPFPFVHYYNKFLSPTSILECNSHKIKIHVYFQSLNILNFVISGLIIWMSIPKTCYNNGQKERLCLIIDKCRRQKLCKRAQKISAAAPLRVMASRYNPCE